MCIVAFNVYHIIFTYGKLLGNGHTQTHTLSLTHSFTHTHTHTHTHTEGCLWWIPAITDKIDCSYLLDCQGIQCQQYYGYIKTASINLEYCADPITVELDLISIYDDDSFQDNFTQSETFLNSNGYNAISIERNDMQLMISVSL